MPCIEWNFPWSLTCATQIERGSIYCTACDAFTFTFKFTFIFAFAVRMTLITGLKTGCLDSAQGSVQLLPFCLSDDAGTQVETSRQWTLMSSPMSSAFSAKTRREVQSKTSIHYKQLCPQINCKFWIDSWAIKTPNAAKFMAPNKVETRLLLLCVSL